MAFNGFSWLSVLQKDKNLIWTGDKTRHNQTVTKLDPPIEIYYPPTYFPSKALFCFNLWIFEAHLVTIFYKYLYVHMFFFFFLHHDIICLSGTILKLVYRWWWYRNNPVPIWQMNSLGRNERGEEGILFY